jgi:hypothetical protein
VRFLKSWTYPCAEGFLGKGRTTFCEQKVAKKLCSFGAWALAATTPMAQSNKNFLRRFS